MSGSRAQDDQYEASATAPLEALAVRIARSAGELALTRRAEGFSVDVKSSATDVVTDVDREVEAFIRAEVAAVRPGDAVLGEEQGNTPAGSDSAVRWIVDPIDGTVNFMLGLPQWSVSVAVEQRGTVVAGCVVNPSTGTLFRASLGGGAYLDDHREIGRRLTGPRAVALADAIVATGFSYDPGRRARQGRVAGELLAHVGNLRRIGSAALDLCNLAAGWVDFYYEGPLNEWDYAAGLLIAQEAGVSTSGLYGRAAGDALVAGGHPQAAPEFFALLEGLGVGADVPDVIWPA